MPAPVTPLLSPRDAASFLGITYGTLAHWRSQGFGPRFVRFGKKIAYTRDALESFIADNTVEAAAKRSMLSRAS